MYLSYCYFKFFLAFAENYNMGAAKILGNLLKFPRKKQVSLDHSLFRHSFRMPLMDGLSEETQIHSEVEHLFFMHCCELFRVLDLCQRNLPTMIEIYSKFRKRTQFEDNLSFRFFESDQKIIAQFDPQLTLAMYSLFNRIHELRISLSYTDEFPSTVEQEIVDTLLVLTEAWNEFILLVQQKYGWNFKQL